MIKPIDPTPKPPEQPEPTQGTARKQPTDGAYNSQNNAPYKYKGMDKPMTWLHMQFTGPEAKKLWDSIIQTVTAQIRTEQARALKALRKLKKSETGDD